jgi:hypothetical protein
LSGGTRRRCPVGRSGLSERTRATGFDHRRCGC